MIEIREAIREQSVEIAKLIMTAMTDDCCLYFCGEDYGLEDFLKILTSGMRHPKYLLRSNSGLMARCSSVRKRV